METDKRKEIETLVLGITQKMGILQKQFDDKKLINYFSKVFMKVGDSPHKDPLLKFFEENKDNTFIDSNDSAEDRKLIQEIKDLYIPTAEESKLFEEHHNLRKEIHELTKKLSLLLN